ncbi:unnamed protein product [Cylicostephanus goldi]|uniref:Uncharacterized protein n=1 Tax=Cylicostephanus goldi TaxID=71465 RepID=A0A3P6RAI0_CYLGO|nr:unnamed protein product [Cylicostephanus goldi]
MLLFACQELNGNVVRRNDASLSEVYATSENVKKEAAKSLSTVSAILETYTEGSEHERTIDALKSNTETKEENDGVNSANPKISTLMQHDENLKTPIPQVKKPGNAHYESGKRFGSRMARDTDDGETEEYVGVDVNGDGNNDEDELAHKPPDKTGGLVKTKRVPASGKVKANAFKPVDVHVRFTSSLFLEF